MLVGAYERVFSRFARLVLENFGSRTIHKLVRLREREKYYTYPALRLIQVLPGHPRADSRDETVSSLQ